MTMEPRRRVSTLSGTRRPSSRRRGCSRRNRDKGEASGFGLVAREDWASTAMAVVLWSPICSSSGGCRQMVGGYHVVVDAHRCRQIRQ